MKEYGNYIFDLYGTLLDIETDEGKPSLWRFMAECYNAYGCEWKPKDLHEAFFKADREERDKLQIKSGNKYPEIKLERVFVRMFLESPAYHNSRMLPSQEIVKLKHELSMTDQGGRCGDQEQGISCSATRVTDYDDIIDELSTCDTITCFANIFRICSRKRLRPYRNTIPFLNYLKERGRKIYLLSNAQAVFTVPEIEASGLMPYFDRVFISSDYGMMKPQKDFMEELLESENLDPKDCVMIGNDISSDIRIAVRCGMDSILLNTWYMTPEDIDISINNMLKEEKAPKRLKPKVVQSGDIGELMGNV